MIFRRGALLLAVMLVASACGAGGVVVPTPTPGPTGTVTGTVGITASALPPAPAAGPIAPPRSNAGRPVYVPTRVMVKFRPDASSVGANALHTQLGTTIVKTIRQVNVQVVRLAPGVSAAAAMAAYRASNLVEYVSQDVYIYATATPNDPLYSSQWHYPQIGLPSAWDITTGGTTIVAVPDTGIAAHPDLSGITVQGRDEIDDDSDPTDPGCATDPTDLSHGTHVIGTIAAQTNNATGVAGVNWGGVAATRTMAIRVLDGCGSGFLSDLAAGIYYAADHGAKVISMSLGADITSDPTTDAAISYARTRGVTLVAAAGNDFCTAVDYPARNSQVIAAAATTNTNARASYSNCGPELDIAAPGGDGSAGVLSTTWSPAAGFVYAAFQGTSMATPHVSGVIALMISRGWVGPAAIQSRLQSTATSLGSPTQFGAGLVNAAAAVGGGTVTARMRIFSGLISGSTITRQSDSVEAVSSGAFTITNAQAGTKTVFAWQDFNNNGVVDTGDSFGQTPGVVINPGATTSGVVVTAQRYTGPALQVR